MIDVENEIFTHIATALRADFQQISVYGDTTISPSSFPCVFVEESDNYTHTRSIDSSGTENYAEVVYDVNIYSNKRAAKKTECKEIRSVIDRVFSDLGFVRKTTQFIPANDADTNRLFARYSAVVSKNKIIYRR